MNGGNKFNRRSIISLLLAVLVLAMAATPALAYVPVEEEDGQLTQVCRVTSDGGELNIHYFGTVQPHGFAEKPLGRPNIAQAEIMSVAAPQFTQISTE